MPARVAWASSRCQIDRLISRQFCRAPHHLLTHRYCSRSLTVCSSRRAPSTSKQYQNDGEEDKRRSGYDDNTIRSLNQGKGTATRQDFLASGKESKIKNPIWRPNNAQGAHDLAALLNSIKALTERSKNVELEPDNVTKREEPAATTDSGEDDLPLSPLEVLKGKRNRKPKRRPTKDELAKLRSNPWAKMLAASVRQCMATRMRFPAPLMLDIGQVVNPNDLEVYLMPDTIADLQDFNKRLQSGKMSKAISLKGGTGDKLRILPYQLTFEKLTDSFIAYDTKSKSGRTRSGTVSKSLFPSRWIQNTEKIAAYNNASRDYYNIAEKQGLEGDLHKRPKPVFDTDKVLWQPTIVGRIPNIMRQRILLCLKRIAEVDSQYNDGSLKHSYRFEWPANTELDLAVVDGSLSIGRDFWIDMGDIEAEGVTSGATQGQGSSVDGRSPISIQPHELDAEANVSRKDHDAWIPGSFLLHLGPPASSQDVSMDSTDCFLDLTQVSAQQHSKFIPPMMTLGAYRLPVFNLYAMFGTQFNDILSNLLAKYPIFRPESALKTGGSDNDHPSLSLDTNFLVLIKSTAPCSHFLIRELWQLWRYLGGTDCLTSPETEEVVRKTKVDMTHNMSPQAWNHLYQLLDMPLVKPDAKGEEAMTPSSDRTQDHVSINTEEEL